MKEHEQKGKNGFLLMKKYGSIFNDMSDKQAGVLIKAIFCYVATGEIMASLNDVELKMAFKFIKQDLDHNAEEYAKLCALRAEWGRKGGKHKQAQGSISQHKVAQCSISKHKDNDVDMKGYDMNNQQQLLTAPKVAERVQSLPKKLNDLQKFSNAVIENFESNVQTPEQKRIWFKRNCRCLTDILTFCGKNIPLALGAIEACVVRLQKANLSGGYEAVCRNLPEYMAQAQKDNLEANYASYQAN